MTRVSPRFWTSTALLVVLLGACGDEQDPEVNRCDGVSCYADATCDVETGDCVCDEDYHDWQDGVGCSIEPLAFAGSYDDNFGSHHEITPTEWTQTGYGLTSRFFISQHSNAGGYVVARNGADNAYNPGKWSRFDWTRFDDGNGLSLWVCQVAFDASSEAEALGTPPAQRDDPSAGGCGGFAWSELADGEPLLSLAGSYADDYGSRYEIVPSVWMTGGFGNPSYFHVTHFSNTERFVVAHNNAHNAFSPGLWSRLDWVWRDEGDGSVLWGCQSAFSAASEAEAIATPAADATDPAKTVCGGFAWSRLTPAAPAPMLAGEWMDNYGMNHSLTSDQWTQWIAGYPEYTYRFDLSQTSNEEGWVTAENHADNPTGAGEWSRFDWTWFDAGDGLELWYCQTVFDADTEEDALAAGRADASDPANGGCGGNAWSKLTPYTQSVCETPQAPALTIVNQGATLTFGADAAGTIEVGTGLPSAVEPDSWAEAASVALTETGSIQVFARLVGDGCEPSLYAFVYDVQATFPPAAGLPGSTAIAMSDTAILGWAADVASVNYGDEVTAEWKTPDNALGAATGTSGDIVALGRGGDITLSFDPPIKNDDGYDFAVFENAFSDDYLELAYVEVSSDGVTFLRFDNAYLGETPVDTYGTHETTLIGSLAGKYRVGFGDPFDLAALANRPEARDGTVDLDNVVYVRVVDVVGDGSATDSFGRVIYDPYPTTGSAGFDLEAIAVLHQQ
jgi:hypothetical protein